MSGSGASRRIGVFGGTFDPVHVGHLAKAAEARDALELDRVLFVPAGRPWMKEGLPMSAGRHRLAMIELSVAADGGFLACDVELRRQGPSYMVDTLSQLKKGPWPDASLYLVVGYDAYEEIDRWHDAERIFALASVAVMPRPGTALEPSALDRVQVVQGTPTDISGAEIRRRVAAGESIEGMVPPGVEAYIHKHGLYRAAEAPVSGDGADD